MAVVFPYLFVSSLATLLTGVNVLGVNRNGNTQYVDNNHYVSSINANERDTFRVYRSTILNVDTSYTTFSGSTNEVYFCINQNDPTQYLQSLQIARNYNDETDRLCYITYRFSSTALIDSWKQSIGGNGTEEYHNLNFLMFSIHYCNSLDLNFTVVGNLNTSYFTNNFKLTSNKTYEDQGDLPYWEEVTYTLSISSRADDQYYQLGYTDGLSNNNGWHLDNYLYSIIDLPVLYLRSLFGFDLWGGVSVFAILTTIITFSLIVFIVRKFI